MAGELVAWARVHPHDFALMYGTPVPGYSAPPETVGAAALVAAPFFRVLAEAPADLPAADSPVEILSPGLRAQAAAFSTGVEPAPSPARVVALFAAFAQLVGLITLELGGHLVGSFDPADEFAAHVIRSLGQALD